MAGSSTFPTSVDNKTALQDGVDYMEADNVNNAYVPTNSTQTFIGANGKGASWSSDILDFLANAKGPICTKKDADEIYVSAGVVFIKNSGQSNRLMRRNTAVTTIAAADIDTGALVIGYYYIYAVADSAATTFTVKFSASASAPTGLTNFELIGWFYNEANGSLDITTGFVGNVKSNGRDVPNQVRRVGDTDDTLNDTSYGTDLTEMQVRFYTSGRPLLILVAIDHTGIGSTLTCVVDIDGTDQTDAEFRGDPGSGTPFTLAFFLMTTQTAGTHTIDVQAKIASSSMTIVKKSITVMEL